MYLYAITQRENHRPQRSPSQRSSESLHGTTQLSSLPLTPNVQGLPSPLQQGSGEGGCSEAELEMPVIMHASPFLCIVQNAPPSSLPCLRKQEEIVAVGLWVE